jgi:hypothetical protein
MTRRNYALTVVCGVVACAASGAMAVPPNDLCCTPSNVGFNGLPVVTYGTTAFDTTGATSDPALTETLCNPLNTGHIYNDIWFTFTAACTGPTSITTCGSTFDTVLAVYHGCPYLWGQFNTPPFAYFCTAEPDQAIACNDDYGPCGLQSLLTFNAMSGTQYLVRVGSYSPSVTGTGQLSISADNCSQPTAIITGPPWLSCQCMPMTISGTATAPPPTFASYRVEYRPLGFGGWTTITTSVTPVVSGTLATWNDPLVPEGYYEIRVTATDTYNSSAEDGLVVYLNRNYDPLNIRKPVAYNPVTGVGIYGGTVCFDGTVFDYPGDCSLNYSVGYSSSGAGPFSPVDPGNPTYPGAIINDPLGSATGDIWNSRTGPTSVADGLWYVKVTGRNTCGTTAETVIQVLIDNTPPVAIITSPVTCTNVTGMVPIKGTVFDTNIAGWTLQYTGGPSSGWSTIGSGTTNMPPNSLLATWNTAGLPLCPYTIRLIASDKATVSCVTSNSTENLVTIDLGCRADFDRDGTVAVLDIFSFLNTWFAGCP